MSMPNKTLSPDLIAELFFKLPSKSLLRFKSVSKLWRSIINDTEFAELSSRPGKLFIKSGKSEYLSIDYEKLMNRRDDDDDNDGDVDGDGDDGQAVEEIINMPRGILDSHDCYFSVIGSCNGLICFMNYENEIYIWNPSTGNSKILPKPNICKRKNFRYYCGFGYDKSIDDHKIVLMVWSELEKKTNIEVLNLKTNAWRKIDQDFDYGKLFRFEGTFFNGALHWVGYSFSSSDPDEKRQVIAFDLKLEKFQAFSQPFYPEEVFCAHFAVLGECLCLYYNEISHAGNETQGIDPYLSTGGTDIWVMKEYGMESSWTKLCSIPGEFDPLCLSKDGQVIGIINITGPVASCNIKEKNLQLVRLYKPSFLTKKTLYQKSLFWPASEDN